MPVPAEAAAVTVASVSRDGRFAVVGIDSGKAPRTSFVIDWQSGTLTEWALATAPEVDVAKFAEARLESYHSPRRHGDSDVRSISGSLRAETRHR